MSREEMNDEEIILTKLESYFEPTRNILYKRYLFHEAAQQHNETVDQYIIRLRRFSRNVRFQECT